MKLLNYLIILFFVTSLTASEPQFTEDEIAWIKNNPIVKLGADYKWPPFDFVDNRGQHTGLSSEYLKLISKKSGLKFDVESGVWSDVLKKMQEKRYDGLACAVETTARKKYLRFSNPYLSVPMVIVTQVENNTLKNINDLKGKKVSINRGSYIHEWLAERYPEINLHLTSSNEESLEALSLGKADAYVGNLAVSTYIMNKYLLSNLKVVKKLKDFKTSVSIAVDKDNKMLFNIIQKSLNSITYQEHQKIKNIWKNNLTLIDKSSKLEFTKQQEEWIKKHQVVEYTGDPNWLPFEAVNEDKQHIGIAAEYIKLIQKFTGITFEYIPSSTWLEAIDKIENATVPMIVETTGSELNLVYTQAFISNSIVIIMNEESRYVEDLNSIANEKIAVIKEYGYVPKLRQAYPNIDFYEVNDIKEGLSAVSTQKYDALLCSSSLASYTISQMGLHNVHIVGKTIVSTDIGFGLIKEYEPFVTIINRALENIQEEEKHQILKKWTYQEYVERINYTLVWQLTGVFVLFLLGTIYWNRRLSAEIEKRKLAQKELIQLNLKLEEATQIAQNANKSKSDFLSNMSHEIRTPMNAILGFAELLDEKIEDKKLKSFLKTIRTSGQTLLFLINDILDLSKIESGKLELIKSRTNLKNIIEETIDIFKLQAEQKALELELELDEDMPSAVVVDQIRLKEILINLIGNALKFTEKGYVKVVVKVDKVYEHTSKIDLTIIVEDSGIGISKVNQEKVFNIFEQSDNQDTKKYGGTGLGLAISKKLALLMGGSLSLTSEVGQGSSFTLCLVNLDIASVHDKESENKSTLDYTSIEFSKARLLVVDDVSENRDLVKESFNGSNIEVLEAENGQKAIDIVKSQDIDLILMDIRMPVMDGYHATRLIKEFSLVPVIALTASIMQDELKKLEGERFNGYLRKPVSKEELFKEVSKFIEYKSRDIPQVEKDFITPVAEDLSNFLNSLEPEIELLHKEATETNNISAITEFAKALLEQASKYKIEYMVNYSELLLEKIDTFEINAISKMLNEYESNIKKLKTVKENA